MALGMIEVYGFATAIVVSDAMAKAAEVKVVAIDKNAPKTDIANWLTRFFTTL